MNKLITPAMGNGALIEVVDLHKRDRKSVV